MWLCAKCQKKQQKFSGPVQVVVTSLFFCLERDLQAQKLDIFKFALPTAKGFPLIPLTSMVFFPRTISLHLRFPQVLWEGILRQPTSQTGKLRFESSVAPLGSSWHEPVSQALDRRLDEQSSCWWRGGRLPPKLHPGSAGNRCQQKNWKSISSFNHNFRPRILCCTDLCCWDPNQWKSWSHLRLKISGF